MLNSELLNDGKFIRNYSTNGMKIMQNETGIIYDEAIDINPCVYTYTETDIPIIAEVLNK